MTAQPVQPKRNLTARYLMIGTLVLACPRQDYIRLWPWPILQPWFEDNDTRYRLT